MTVGCGTSTIAIPKFTKVAFISTRSVNPPTSMFTSNLDGTNVTPIPFSTTNVQNLSSSADGKTVTFVAYIAGSYSLWIGNSDGTGQKQLTTPGNIYWARLSPNGKQIVYSDNMNHISIMSADGTGFLDLTPTLPTNMMRCYEPSFSADSSQVVFGCYGSAMYGIYTVKTDGSGTKTVEVRGNKTVDYPFFTPDGKKIIFVGNSFAVAATHNQAINPYSVGSVNIDGTGETVLVTNANEAVVMNSSLYYATGNNCSRQIFKANLDGTTPVAVTDGKSNDDLFYNSCW